jgi:hypothetical protein
MPTEEQATMTDLFRIIGVDASPIDTDWEDIHDLWADMEKFAQEHQGHMFLCADDPGFNHEPPRVPRLGWVAYRDNPDDEQAKMWTITVRNVRRTFKRKPTNLDFSDRKKMLDKITIRDD